MPKNIEDNKEYQQAIKDQTLSSLINSMSDAVIGLDKNLEISTYNASALSLLDINNINPKTHISSILHPIDKDGQALEITEIIQKASKPIINRELRIKYSDESIINLYIAISPVKIAFGQINTIGYVLLLRDITKEKSLEEERDEFISVVSHELRTPIAISEGNISNAELIVEKNGDINFVKQALKEAHNQILFLADMINDLATLSRAERGVLQLEIEPINTVELVKELQNSYIGDITDKRLQLKIDTDPKLKILHSSKLYVKEIIQNFITNAIKYTSSGYIQISVKAYDKGVIFEIMDTGIGISKNDQTKIYDKFFRSEDYRTRQSNGTGLGLYVTLKLARLIHAELDLKSKLNHGSTFIVKIPNLA